MMQLIICLHLPFSWPSFLAGRIDHAHHGNQAQRASLETWQFSDAVQKAIDMTNSEDTLIVVTADHGHVVTLNGYTHIDTPIYGKVSLCNSGLRNNL